MASRKKGATSARGSTPRSGDRQVAARTDRKVAGKKAPARTATRKKTSSKQAASKPAAPKQAAPKRAATRPAAQPAGAAASRVDRRQPKPPAAPRPKLDVDPDVLEFIAAIDAFKKKHGRPFPSWSEVLHVLHQLGYRKTG